ncbi:MAG: hypothetical protein Kow0031_02700 [Anaerolineae bacterium]
MTVGVQLYSGNFALAVAVRLPMVRFDWSLSLLLATMVVVLVTLSVTGLSLTTAVVAGAALWPAGLVLALEIWQWRGYEPD